MRLGIAVRVAAGVLLASTLGAQERGATLRLRWNSAEAGLERISLLPIDVALPAGLSRQRVIALWTRPLAGTEQTWSGLPAGTYQIVVRSTVPRDAGEVVLAPGDDRAIEIAVRPREAAPAAPPLHLAIARSGEGVQRATALLAANGVLRKVALLPEPGSGGTVLTVAGGCVAGGTFVLQMPEQVAALPLDGVCPDTASLLLQPRATLIARFTVPAGVSPPRLGWIRFAGCTTWPFAIAGGQAEIGVPAGCRATSVHFDAFAPVPLPVRALAAGESHHAGTIALKSGAAAVVRVRSASDARPLSAVHVSAVAAADFTAMHDRLDDEARAIATAVTDAAGWARLTGLPDAKVVFILRHPAWRRANVSEPYRLGPGEEAVLDDLVLEPPSSVFITLSLPEGLERALRVDRVELRPARSNRWPSRVPLAGELTSTGAVVEDVPAGTWSVRALGRLASGFVTDLATATIDVAAGADAFVTLTVSDRIYRGRVTRDGTAVVGTINLKSVERATGGRHAVATLAKDGTFEVLLNRTGDYAATVQEPSGTMTRLNRYVTFEDGGEEVEIELPAGRIEGRVVDGAGAAVAGAGVAAAEQLARDPAGVAGTRTDRDGRFVIESVGPGTWELVAQTSEGKSEPVMVSFDARDVKGVTLVLDPTRTVAIRVVDAMGNPLRDAFVNVELPPRSGQHSRGEVHSTNANGVARVQLSRSDQQAWTNVVVATWDARISCALVRLDSDQTIAVPPSFGEARLIRREWRFTSDVHPRLVSSSGCSVPFLGARSEPDPQGGSAKILLPLPVGPWRYVEVQGSEALAALLTGHAGHFPSIEEFTIEPQRVTRVALTR